MSDGAQRRPTEPHDEFALLRLQHRARPKAAQDDGTPVRVGDQPSVRLRILPHLQGLLATRMREERKSAPEVIYEALEQHLRAGGELVS